MDTTVKIRLIAENYEKDEAGQMVPNETQRMIWGRKAPITRAEWGASGRQGLKPSFMVKVRTQEYRGEPTAEVAGRRYGIYRSYQDGEQTELYLEAKVGED